MYFYRSAKRSLSVTLVLVLLVFPIVDHVAAAQSEPVVGPSGVTMEEMGVLPPYEGPVIAPAETFWVEGGLDIQLGGTNEPAIAVNPLDPDNIAVASLFALRVSIDNGATFSAPTLAPVPAGFLRAGDPSLAFDTHGRLFWTYLGQRTDNGNLDVFISQVDPATGAILAGYPVNVTAGAGFPASIATNSNDKEWLAADRFRGSPFADRLYVVWTRFDGLGGTFVHTTFSANQGLTWSAALTVSAAGEGFVWPSHNAVARNGDVYVAYHSQPTFTGGAPNGISGQTFVLRSTDGGVTYPQKTTAYTAGNADITFNVQTAARTLNQSVSWTQGSAQPWVLPDPIRPLHVYVVAADDPTNVNHGVGFDDMNVFIVRSTDQGLTWNAPVQIDKGPVATTQFFPTAGISDKSGCLTVAWYDTRAGATNAANNFLLDVFLRSSTDGGVTFGPEVRINDVPFNPDLGAPARFPGPPPTLRIGEYIGVAAVNGIAHAVWTGNTATGQQTLFDSAIACQADLLIQNMTDSPDPVSVGGELTYRIRVSNNGPLTATEVEITDTLPANVNFVSASGGCSRSGRTVTCELGNLRDGETAVRLIRVRPTAPGKVSNTATITGNETDPEPANNTATTVTTVR